MAEKPQNSDGNQLAPPPVTYPPNFTKFHHYTTDHPGGAWNTSQEGWGSDIERFSDSKSSHHRPRSHDELTDEVGSSVSANNKGRQNFSKMIAAVPKKKEMMGEHKSYHQSITGREAERRLKIFGRNGYLTRYSKSQKCYVLSVYRKQRPDDAIEHLGITIEQNGKHKIKGREDEDFDSIGDLLEYYEKNRITPGLPNIGRCYTEEEFDMQQDELDKQKEEEEQRPLKELECRLSHESAGWVTPVKTTQSYDLYYPNRSTPGDDELASSDMERLSENNERLMPVDYQDDELGSSVSAQLKEREFSGPITTMLPKKELMGEHASYHQSIKAEEAERRLKMFGKDCYLTRYSNTRKCYVLSVYRKQRPEDVIEHFRIIVDNNGKHKLYNDDDFETISALLEYYETHRISPAFPTIGKCYTEDKFNKQLNLIEEKVEQEEKKINQLEAEHIRLLEEAREKERELKEAKKAAEATERWRLQDLQAAEEQKRRELQQEALQRAEVQRQQEIQAQKWEAETQKAVTEAAEAQRQEAEAQKREAEVQITWVSYFKTDTTPADIRGIEIIQEAKVHLTNKQQNFEWKGYGLKLHIPPQSLPSDVTFCTITIKASLSGLYEFPTDTVLVSPVFWLQCNPSCKFKTPLNLEIAHCAPLKNSSNLFMARALCTQSSLPYTFKVIKGGIFSTHSSFGMISLERFSALSVIQVGTDERCYWSSVFYIEPRMRRQKVHFAVTWDDDVHITTLKKVYETKNAVDGPQQPIVFKEKFITLGIPKDGCNQSGWRLCPTISPKIYKSDVDNYHYRNKSMALPYCEIEVWPNLEHEIKTLEYSVDIHGAGEDKYFTIIINSSDFQLPTDPVVTVVRSEDVRFLLSHLCQYAAKWRKIGYSLNFLEGELENIDHSDHSSSAQDQLAKLLSQWSQWPTTSHPDKPTMENLCAAMRSDMVGLGAKADELFKLKNVLPSCKKH